MTSALLAIVAVLQAPEAPVRVGVYTPSVYFKTLESKARFLSELESGLSDALGRTASAASVANPKELASMDVWLVDARVAVADRRAAVVRQARRRGTASWQVGVFSKVDGTGIATLKGPRLSLPGSDAAARDILRYWLLLDEPGARKIAKSARPMRDAAAALAAVAAGELGAAVVPSLSYAELDPKVAGVKRVADLGRVPLPVLAINSARAGPAAASELNRLLVAAALPIVEGVIEGWGAPNPTTLRELRDVLSGRRPPINRDPVLAPLPRLVADLRGLLPQPPEPAALTPDLFFSAPDVPALPDPPRSPPVRSVASFDPSTSN